MEKLISLIEARELNLPRYFTGKPCKHGHIVERLTSNRGCVTCGYIRRIAWEVKNKPAVLAKAAINAKRNRKENKEATQASRKLWALKNKTRDNAYSVKWRLNNKGHKNALTRNRQAAKLQRTPIWLTEIDKERIQNEYKLAALLTKLTGKSWHVDHIIPLQGKNVSGLHTPSNLQVMKGAENISKGNSYAL